MTKAKAKDDGLVLFDAPAEKTEKHDEALRTAVALKPVKGRAVAAPAQEATLALLQTVERLSTHPGVNPAIVEMLLREMRDLRAEQAKIRFDAALAEVQGVLPIIDRKGKITVRARDGKGERTGAVTQSTPYALYEDIVEKVLPLLSEKGFSISHITDTEGTVKVESVLSGYGHERRTKLTLMHDATGSKNSVQAIVSSVSYAKRVNLCSLLSIATRGEDDDGAATGEAVTAGEPLSAEQTEQLFDFCKALDVPRKALLDLMNKTRPKGHPEAKEIGQLPAVRFDEAIDELRKVEAYNKERAVKSKAEARA